MTYERRQVIEKLAESIRKNFNIVTPIEIENVVEMLHGELKPITFEDSTISGRIQKINDTFEISYNAEHTEARSRFTIAHELGHLFLHMGFIINPEKWNSIDEYYDSPKYRQGYSEEEYEANQFAGAFLMPAEEYRDFVNEHKKDNAIKIDLIANHFDVSFDAALTRGKWLGIFAW